MESEKAWRRATKMAKVWGNHCGRRGQKWLCHCFERQILGIFTDSPTLVGKVATELLLSKCHSAGGVHSEGTTESSWAPMLFQNTISYCRHRALRAELLGTAF